MEAVRVLPLLLAAFESKFDKCYLMSVIVPRAVAAVGREAAATLLLCVKTNEADDERLRDNAIHIYTRPELYEETNRLMRLESDGNEPEAPLWWLVAILQLAFVKALKDSTGGTLYRGGLLSKAELAAVGKALAAGHEGEIVLRGVTSCSRSEEVAIDFARSATMVRVLFWVSLVQVEYTVAMARQSGLPYGPAVSVELISKFPEEKEVILLDGTVLKVSPGDLKECGLKGSSGDVTERGTTTTCAHDPGPYDFECVQIKARVDWDELGAYFALCDKAKPSPM